MTENESIKIIGNIPVAQVDCDNMGEIVQAYTVVQKSLEELEQYRAIGTIEEFKILKENTKEHDKIIMGYALENYHTKVRSEILIKYSSKYNVPLEVMQSVLDEMLDFKEEDLKQIYNFHVTKWQ